MTIDPGVLELILLYVLGVPATFFFLLSKARRRGLKFHSFTVWAALFWPVFLGYAMVRIVKDLSR